MSWTTRLVWIAGITVTVLIAAVLMHRHQARRLADEEARLADMRRQVEQLSEVKARVEELERRKKEYESRIAAVEALRANPGPRILAVAKTAEALGFPIDEMSLSGAELVVVYRAASADEAQRLADELEKAGVTTRSAVTPRGGRLFALTARFLPAPPRPPAAP